MNQNRDAKVHEAETLAYKQFMKVAKKITYLQYGKWDIVPDIKDPLRKFTLEKKTDWCTVKLCLRMEQFYHRADYTENRYDYRAKVVVYGLFANMSATSLSGKLTPNELYMNTGMRLKPRMAKKLILAIDEVIIPKFYLEVDNDRKQYENAVLARTNFAQNVKKVVGMQLVKNTWNNRQYGKLTHCPLELELYPDEVRMNGSLSYDVFAKLAESMGWGK